jgi:hypothetical protein
VDGQTASASATWEGGRSGGRRCLARLRDVRTQQIRNDAWADALLTAHALGRDPLSAGLLEGTARRALTVEGIHEALRRYLPADRFTVVTVVPENVR